MAHTARTEMYRILSKLRVAGGLKHNVPGAADVAYDTGDLALVWTDKAASHRIGDWLGPYAVASMGARKKLVYVQDSDGSPWKPVNVVQIKRYFKPPWVAESLFADIHTGLSHFTSDEQGDCDIEGSVLQLARDVGGKEGRDTRTTKAQNIQCHPSRRAPSGCQRSTRPLCLGD